jgi:hypothetical protein
VAGNILRMLGPERPMIMTEYDEYFVTADGRDQLTFVRALQVCPSGTQPRSSKLNMGIWTLSRLEDEKSQPR